MDRYRYKPIPRGTNIRVLRILPGSDEDMVCELRPADLGSLPYLALSYVWGNYEAPTALPKIIIQESVGTSRNRWDLAVRRNLFAALKQLRHPIKDIDCWADAVCIDFENVEERESQLALIQSIYHGAERIMFWLGSQEDYTVEAFKCINMLNRTGWEKDLATERYQQLRCFRQLLANVWFSRRWIIQEVAFARSAVLVSGPCSIYWSVFLEAASAYFAFQNRIEFLPKSHAEEFGKYSTQAAKILIDVTSGISRWRPIKSKSRERLNALEKKRSNDMEEDARHVTELLEEERILIKECDAEGTMEFIFTLEKLIDVLYPHEVSDYRDTIYAVLSLAKDTTRSPSTTLQPFVELDYSAKNYHNIHPDYSKDVFEVYKDFTKYCTQRTSPYPLDIICRPWVPKSIKRMFPGNQPTENSIMQLHPLDALGLNEMKWVYTRGLASWMPTTERLAFDHTQSPERRNANSLVGLPDHPIYDASKSSGSEISFGESLQLVASHRPKSKDKRLDKPEEVRRVISDGTISVRGIQLDIIETLGSHYEGIITEEWLLIGGWSGKRSRWRGPPPVPDALWRTLVADRDPSENPPKKPDFKAAFKRVIGHRDERNNISTSSLIAQGDSIISKFLERVNDVAWNRRLIRTNKLKRLGLAPLDAMERDILCVLYGCSVPVVLRALRNMEEKETGEYQLVGECYLDGMMDGEGVSNSRLRQARKDGSERIFVLR